MLPVPSCFLTLLAKGLGLTSVFALVTDDSLKELVLPPLPEEPPILEDAVHTWSIDAWNSLSKKEHGPTFNAGGHPWCVSFRGPPAYLPCTICPASGAHPLFSSPSCLGSKGQRP